MRKVFFIIALMALTVTGAKAQDLMTKRDGSELNVKVTEIGENEVKYRLSGDDSGPVRSISKSELFRIKYANGSTDVFDQSDSKKKVKRNDGDSDYRKGYAGLGIGVSSLMKNYDDLKTGFQFNVNAGYLFKEHIGITASFLLTSYKIKDSDGAKTGLRGGLVGPLISFKNYSGKIEYDIRPTVGLVSGKISGDNASLSTDKMTFALGVGGSMRFNVSDFISLSVNLDTYYHGDLEIESIGFEFQTLSSAG
jgi:hypothetical protein